MKKIILVPALLGVMGIGGFIAIAGGDITSSANTTDRLSIKEIEQLALKEVKGKVHDIEFEKEAIRSIYEVEVWTEDAEYDLKFDAFTGELLKKRIDDVKRNFTNNINQQSTKVNNINNSQPSPSQPNTITSQYQDDDYFDDDWDDMYDDDRFDDDDWDDDNDDD